MKAILLKEFGSVDNFKFGDYPDPKIGDDEVLVKIKYFGLNHVDLDLRRGYLGPIPFPHIMGSEFVGIVLEKGAKVVDYKIGDRVVGLTWQFCGNCSFCRNGYTELCDNLIFLGWQRNGSYAELVSVPQNSLVLVPNDLDDIQACASGITMLTAWHMFQKLDVTKDSSILIHSSSSGIGSCAVEIAKYYNLNIIVTTSSKKMGFAKELGVEKIINYETEKISQKVLSVTNKKGVDYIIEHVGSATWNESMLSLSKNGKVITCGATTGYDVNINLIDLFANEKTILGSRGGRIDELKMVLELLAKKQLKIQMDSVLSYKDIKEAHDKLEQSEHNGKIILTFQ